MADTKFTPGPWSAEDPMDGWVVRADDPNRAGKRFLICDIGPSYRSRADEIQAHANAHLIIAAPTLYAAAEQAAAVLGKMADTKATTDAYVALIFALAQARREHAR